jgi:crossover junction endodeoxyribonuclease RuvC
VISIGIDPGLSGAVGVINRKFEAELVHTLSVAEGGLGRGTAIETIHVFDTPTALVEGEKTKRKYLMGAMALLLQPYAKRQDVIAVLENVHSMPKQGVSSSFCFGEGKGIWEGILAAFEIPMMLVSPQRWKKEMMDGQGKEKSAARFKAMALFPALSDQLKLVKHDGRAEALLMAEYALRLRSGK